MTLAWEELDDRWENDTGQTALRNALDALRRREENWERHLSPIAERAVVQNGRDLRWAPLGKATLEGVELNSVDLSDANLTSANLKGAHIVRSTLVRTRLNYADLTGVSATGSDFRRAELNHSKLIHASLHDMEILGESVGRGAFGHKGYNRFSDAHFEYADLTGVLMRAADLSGVHAKQAVLRDADLTNCDLRGADLSGADLTGVVLEGVMLKNTVLAKVMFASSHDPHIDKAEFIVLARRDRFLNWSRLKGLIRPLLWLASISTVLHLKDIVAWLTPRLTPNGTVGQLGQFTAVDAVFVLASAGLFHVLAPSTVQEYSETQWVEDHGRPRLLYLRESVAHKGQVVTLVFALAAWACTTILVLVWLADCVRRIATG